MVSMMMIQEEVERERKGISCGVESEFHLKKID